MALTFKETVFYQDQVDSGLEALDKGGLPFKVELATQDQVTEAIEKLTGAKAEKSLYERIKDGEFNHIAIGKFVDKVREALKAVNGDGAQEAKDCAIQYMKAHYDSAKHMFVAA